MDRRLRRPLASAGLLVAVTFAVLHVDLGWSPSNSRPVTRVIAEGLPATIELACFAFIAAVLFGAGLGFVRSRTRAPVLRELLAVPQLAGRALPVVILTLFLQLLLIFKTSLPVAGMASSDAFDLRDQLVHLIVPVLCLAVPFGAWASLIFYGFFRAAREASATPARSLVGPIATTAASIGPALLAASLVIEPRFAWAGIARQFFNGLSQFDFALVAGCLVAYAIGVAVIKICAALAPDVPVPPPPPRRGISFVGALALVVLIAAVVGAAGAELIAPIGPYFIDQAHWQGYPLAPGTAGHVLGTEENGRDLLARLLVGIRTSLFIAALAAIVASAIAAVVAKAAKALPWFDGRVSLSAAGIRPFAAFPFILAAVMVLVAVLGRTSFLKPVQIALVIAVVSWPAIVAAFRPAGRATLGSAIDVAACALLLEVSQSSIGFGVQPPTPSLGNMLVNVQSNMSVAPWAAIIPSVTIVVLLFALYALGDELRER